MEIVTGARLVEGAAGVVKEGAQLLSISTSKGDFRGRIFIDATIEGDLLDSAGVTTVIGREPNSRYGETMNGIRAETTHHQFSVEVDPHRVPGDPSSGTLPGVLDEAFGEPGTGDHRIHAYCFRVCFTDDPGNRLPLPKPEQYDRGNYELHLRYLRAGGKFYLPGVNLPNRKTDFNGGRDLSHNLNGMNHGYPGGSNEEGRGILIHHRDYTQGLFWFLANDPEVGRLAPELQEGWSRWGLPKDEFTDNGGWPRMFYVRDARRMLSDYVITEHHVRKTDPVPVEDPVAMAYWPPDVHNFRTIVVDGHAYNEGFVFGGDDWKPFGISYRALVPKAAEASNLLTPTCPSASHEGCRSQQPPDTDLSLCQSHCLRRHPHRIHLHGPRPGLCHRRRPCPRERTFRSGSALRSAPGSIARRRKGARFGGIARCSHCRGPPERKLAAGTAEHDPGGPGNCSCLAVLVEQPDYQRADLSRPALTAVGDFPSSIMRKIRAQREARKQVKKMT